MVFPCLVYLASIGTYSILLQVGGPLANFHDIAMGIVRIKSRLDVDSNFVTLGTAYFLICFSLNALLTLMIVTRLILHRRNIRKAMGASDKTSGLYTTIAVMLVESYAIYAAALLSYIVSSTLQSWVMTIFSKTTGQIQVCVALASLAEILKCCLTITTHRSSLRISSLYELPIGER